MRLLSFAALASALFAVVAMSTPVLAANPVGTAIAVRAGATASGENGSRGLSAGSPVYLGDRLQTGIFGHVDIEFTDHTKLAVGPNSSMVIDRYVLGSPGRLRSFGLKTARGAFRFLTGDSAKRAYRITTPTATIGIRGTEFDWAIGRVASTALALYGGATRICSLSSGVCANLNKSCEAALVYDGRVVKTTTQALTGQQTRMAFPFLRDEARVSASLRVGSARCEGGVPGVSSPPTSGRGSGKSDATTRGQGSRAF